jgi:hypothetical protein
MHKILSNVECLVLLHSPIIINLEKLGTINKEVNDDCMQLQQASQQKCITLDAKFHWVHVPEFFW